MYTYFTFGFLMAEQGLASNCSKSQAKYAGKAKLASAPANSIMADTTPSHSSGICSLQKLWLETWLLSWKSQREPHLHLAQPRGGELGCLLGLVLLDHNSRRENLKIVRTIWISVRLISWKNQNTREGGVYCIIFPASL